LGLAKIKLIYNDSEEKVMKHFHHNLLGIESAIYYKNTTAILFESEVVPAVLPSIQKPSLNIIPTDLPLLPLNHHSHKMD
jgi:hypothetical protein